MSVQKPLIQKLAVIGFAGPSTGTYTKFTEQAYSFSRDPFSITHIPANGDYLYLGRPKAFNAVYLNLTTPNTAALTLSAQYWNGTAWTALTLLTEDTNGFKRSGYLKWDKMAIINGSSSDWKATVVNGDGNSWFYIRIQLSGPTTPAAVQFTGIGLVFADDRDMKETQANIMKYLPKDETGIQQSSFITAHVEARDVLLGWFNEAGIKKFSVADGNYWAVDEWDFHNIMEVRKAAKYLALWVVHKNQITEKDDAWDRKSKSYFSLAKQSITLALCSIDLNDDGYEGIEEKNSSFQSGFLVR